MVNSLGHPKHFIFLDDKAIHKVFRIHKTLNKPNPFRENFLFHYLPKVYFGFKDSILVRIWLWIFLFIDPFPRSYPQFLQLYPSSTDQPRKLISHRVHAGARNCTVGLDAQVAVNRIKSILRQVACGHETVPPDHYPMDAESKWK